MEPIAENKPAFDTQEEVKLEKCESLSQFEPLSGNLPEFDDALKLEETGQAQVADAEVMPIKENEPLMREVSDRHLERESQLRQSMVEPIPKPKPIARAEEPKPLEEENHESLVEPIDKPAHVIEA